MSTDTSHLPARERMLQVAKQLFAERGYENTSTVAIARAAGSSESQLMKHFGSKEGLLEAVFDQGWSILTERLGDLDSLRDGRMRPAHRLRQRRQFAASALGFASKRNQHSDRARRQPLAHRQTTTLRERAPECGRWRDRVNDRDLGARFIEGIFAGEHSTDRRSVARSSRYCVYSAC